MKVAPARLAACCSTAWSLALWLASAGAANAAGWVPLFDGKSLDGWVAPAGENARNFSVKDGWIHIEGRSGWLRTEKLYSNFSLRARVHFVSPDGTGNTGIFLRSPETSTFGPGWPGKSFEFETRDMRVNRGPSPPALGQVLRLGGTGGGPPEGRAIFDAAAAKRAYERSGEYADLELVANADRIWTFVNGELISSVWGVTQPTGHIGLQSEAGITEFQSLEVRVLDSYQGGYRSLFNGKDTTGWISQGSASGTPAAQGDQLVVTDGGPSLRTADRFSEFHLKFQFRAQGKDDVASVAIRASDAFDAAAAPIEGVEIQLRNLDPAHEPTSLVNDPRWPGAILRRGTNVGQGSFDTAAALAAAKPVGSWQDVDIDVVGASVSVKLNGVPVSNADGLPNGRGGAIVLRPGKGRVEFRNLLIQDPTGESTLEAAAASR